MCQLLHNGLFHWNCIDDVLVVVLMSSSVYCEFDLWLGQISHSKIGICVSPLSTQQWERSTTCWLGIRIMCPSDATCLPMDISEQCVWVMQHFYLWASQNNVSEWCNMSTLGISEYCVRVMQHVYLWLSQNNVSEWCNMSTYGYLRIMCPSDATFLPMGISE